MVKSLRSYVRCHVPSSVRIGFNFRTANGPDVGPSRSELPPFLAKNSGLESGLMIVQYVAGSSLAEMHGHAAPRSAFSTTTSAGQEDHVSMGATAAWNLRCAVQRLSEVLACELLIASKLWNTHNTNPRLTSADFFNVSELFPAPWSQTVRHLLNSNN